MIFLTNNYTKGETNTEPVFKLHTSDFFNQLDYDIYSLILEEYYSDSVSMVIRQKLDYNLAPIIYNCQCTGNDYYNYIKANMSEIDTNAYLNFISINDSVNYLDNLFNSNTTRVKLISEEEYDSFLDRDYREDKWGIFYDKYPNSNGLIELSRIGFNQDLNQAILEIWHSVGESGSNGIIYFLTKIDDIWVVISTNQTRTN